MKILKFILKYFTLIFLFAIIFYLTKSYGNYCGDLYIQMIFLPFLGILFFINLTVLYFFDYKNKTYKITNKILLFLLLLLSINILFGYFDSKRKVKYIIEPNSEYNTLTLKLLENNSYRLSKQYNHGSCNYVGKYKIENDILKFDDSEIKEQSGNQITMEYKYDHSKKTFKSLNATYNNLKIVDE